MEAISRRFEISLNLAEKYARVWRTFFAEGKEIFNVEEIFLSEPSWYVVAATESPDPNRWLAYAQDKKAERPGYSISEFRREIQRAVQADGSTIQTPAREVATVAPRIKVDLSLGAAVLHAFRTACAGRAVPLRSLRPSGTNEKRLRDSPHRLRRG